MATVFKAKAHDKWLADKQARELQTIEATVLRHLDSIADGLTVASNNWFDDYSYGHLTPEEEKLYETWRELTELIRRK
jgi:hypothetical protein